MVMPKQLWLCIVIKILVVLLTIAVLILLDPTYVTAYISINYEIVLIYIVSALTLLYVIVSIIFYCLIGRNNGEEDYVPTNLALTEVVLCTAGIMGWLIIIGIGGTVSQRTIIETGERFGWLAACAGINTGCFLAIAGLFLLVIINDKIINRRARYEKGSRNAYQGY